MCSTLSELTLYKVYRRDSFHCKQERTTSHSSIPRSALLHPPAWDPEMSRSEEACPRRLTRGGLPEELWARKRRCVLYGSLFSIRKQIKEVWHTAGIIPKHYLKTFPLDITFILTVACIHNCYNGDMMFTSANSCLLCQHSLYSPLFCCILCFIDRTVFVCI